MTTAPPRTGPMPVARLSGLKPYEPPAPGSSIDLRLDANEGPAPDAGLLARLFKNLGGTLPELLRRYPDASALERRLAELHGVDPARVVVTTGGDDAIDRLCRAVLEPGREAIVHLPTFVMIPRGIRLAGATLVEIPWLEGPFPRSDALGRITPSTAMIALVSPNNPTGAVIETQDILAVADAAPHAAVLVDLAYVEFADADPTPALLKSPNAVLVRTFSKARGLAGLRVGYAVAPPEIARWLRTTGSPYPVSALSLAIAGGVLDDPAPLAATVERVRAERGALLALLGRIGANPLPSQANFVTARITGAESVRRALAERGIAVRTFPKPGTEDLLRVTLPGNEHEYARLTAALAESIRSTA
jgi:histidinol-phosphate aminotransferase